ncbi:MAG: hypothetical protein AAF399_17135, partial [Bacteroidota bacterium]
FFIPIFIFTTSVFAQSPPPIIQPDFHEKFPTTPELNLIVDGSEGEVRDFWEEYIETHYDVKVKGNGWLSSASSTMIAKEVTLTDEGPKELHAEVEDNGTSTVLTMYQPSLQKIYDNEFAIYQFNHQGWDLLEDFSQAFQIHEQHATVDSLNQRVAELTERKQDVLEEQQEMRETMSDLQTQMAELNMRQEELRNELAEGAEWLEATETMLKKSQNRMNIAESKLLSISR